MKRALAALVLVGLVGCDGLNSSYKQNESGASGEQPTPVQKPTTCEFDFAKTCWAESAAAATSCLSASGKQETFNQTKEFCTNDEGKLIAFANPAAMFALPMDLNITPVDFRVFPDSVNECMRVEGTPQKFKVTMSSSLKTMEFDFSSERVQFKCLDGQTVTVPYEVFEGCAQSLGDKFVNTVPGLQMMLQSKGPKPQWTFRLRGAPATPDLFSCVEP